jgi:hypothetical protein
LEALDVLDEKSFNILYNSFTKFADELEKQDNKKIINSNFSSFDLQELEKQNNEIQQEKNTFNLFLNNI